MKAAKMKVWRAYITCASLNSAKIRTYQYT